MKDTDQRFLEYWQKRRQQGAVKFSLITGLTYGIFVIVFSKVFAWNWHFTQKDIGYGVLSLLIGVTILGPFIWWYRERRYKKLLAEQQQAQKKAKKKKRK